MACAPTCKTDAMAVSGGAEREGYAAQLAAKQSARWKRVLDVQRPYRKIISEYCQGKVLEIGSGAGRNLRNLAGRAVGIDIDEGAVAICRDQGLVAYTPEQFAGSPDDLKGSYGALLLSHVLEHVSQADGDGLIDEYLPYLKPGGTVMMICPQERGYASDDTHIRWVDFTGLAAHVHQAGLESVREFSFPLPRLFGKAFIYNEFIHVAQISDSGYGG
jgi:2-polyprenyl-3-methyl-5-hydroxy-6-metoxy-1,4-benzoquinol methylase